MLRIVRKPLPVGAPAAEEFDSVRVVPFSDRSLAYAMLVPKSFEALTDVPRRNLTRSERQLVGRFARGSCAITVHVLGLDREVSLLDLVKYEQQRGGLTLRAADATAYEGHEAIDGLATREVEGKGTELLRLVLVRLGGRLFELSARAPLEEHNDLADAFATSLGSFRLKEPGTEPLLEPFDFVASTGAIPLGFRVARSWKVREHRDAPYGRQVLDAMLIERGDMKACLRVEAFDTDAYAPVSLDKIGREVTRELAGLGFQIGSLRTRSKSMLPGGIFGAHARSEVYQGRAFGAEAEARVSTEITPRVVHAVTCVTPRRSDDPFVFMIGRRAQEIAILTLNKPDVDFLVPRTALRALRPVSVVSPLYNEHGELDELTFDRFGLDESATEGPEGALTEWDTEAAPTDTDGVSLVDVDPILLREIQAELDDAERDQLERYLGS
jgi:hypothetical protein